MALRRGMGRIKEAKKQADRQRERYSNRTPEIFLRNDGDSVTMWLNGSAADEPVQAEYHTIKKLLPNGKEIYDFELCGAGFPGHEGCVYCWANQNGQKNVGKKTSNFVWNAVDMRYVHKVPNDEKTAKGGGDVRYDWHDCPVEGEELDGAECEWCARMEKSLERGKKSKILREARGKSRIRLGVTVASNLSSQNDRLTRKCVACGGKIKADGFRKGKKVLPDIEDVEDPENWTAQYVCSKCDDPTPLNIHLVPVTMTRSGKGKQTSYNFNMGSVEDPPPWVQEIEPANLEETLIPRTADEMAEHLKIPNPFSANGGGGKIRSGGSAYDDDDEDDGTSERKPKTAKKAFDEDEDD